MFFTPGISKVCYYFSVQFVAGLSWEHMKRKLIFILVAALASWGIQAALNPHITELDLNIDGVADYDEFYEPSPSITPKGPGGFVCSNGWNKITLKAVGVNDPMKTRLNWNSAKIDVWTATNGGTQVLSPTNYSPASSMPTQLWVKGVSASATGPTKDASGNWTNCGPETLCLEAINNGANPTTPGTYYDRVAFTVVNVDVDAFWPAIISTLGQAVTEAEEADPMNLFLAVNDDDDNGDGVVDNEGASASSIDAEDDEMAALIVRQFAPSGLTGTLTMEIPSGLRLFSAAGVPVSTPVTVDLSAPTGPLAGILTGDVKFFIEATATSSNAAVVLRFTPSVGSSITDAVHMTLTSTDVTGGYTRGSIKFAVVQKMDGRWCVGGTVSSDYPLYVFMPVPTNLVGVSSAGMKYGLVGGVMTNGLLLNAAVFNDVADSFNVILAPINAMLAFLGLPTIPLYTADIVANGLSAASLISAADLKAGKYFETGPITTPGLYNVDFFKDASAGKKLSSEKLIVLKVDLGGDTDRDGDIDEDDETGEETNTLTRGILVTPPLRALVATGNDITGLATLTIKAQPTGPLAGLSLKLKKTYEASGCTLQFLTTNGMKLPDIGNGQSYSFSDWPTNTITLAVMPQYARPLTTSTWPIRFDLELQAVDASANVVCSDTVRLKVAPLILPPECNTPQKIYTTTISGISGATSMDATDAQAWAQDMVKFVKYQIADGQTGDMFVDLEHEGKSSFLDKLRSDENWDGTNVWPVEMWGDGGNIMATPALPDAPFGKLLIGSAKTGKPDPLPYWEGQGAQPTVRITNDWLMVGHVDEIIMWVASDKVLYADPWKAADLLHQEIAAGHQTNGLWFGFDAAGTNKTIQQVVIATNGGGFKLTVLPAPGLSTSTSPATLVFSNTIFVADDVLRVDDEILKVTSANGSTVTVARAQAGRPATAHATGSLIYAYTAVLKANLPVDPAGVSVVERMATTTNQLRQAIGSYTATIVPMPVLFEYTTVDGVSGYAAKSANVVNCLLSTGGTICYSESGCSVFRNYISSVLPTAQEVAGGWEGLHCFYGEIHCATAAQRQLYLATPWWKQLNDWE
jgi:hypothetical protein